MTVRHIESVEDSKQLLEQDDHMHGMERLEMVVEKIERPFPSVSRVTGRIAPSHPAQWRRPNLAVRLEVETPEGERPISRVYTVRSFDEANSLVEIDFVLHVDDSPAMRWLNTAKPGTTLFLVGPRPHYLPDYAAGRKIAVFADETAIPAVYAILQSWQPGVEGSVFIETSDPEAFHDLPVVEGVERHLLQRDSGEMAGTTGKLALAAQSLREPHQWSVWAAGERQEVRAIRKYFEEHGLSRETVRVFGYWRLGVSSSQIDRTRLSHYGEARSGEQTSRRLDDLDLPL